MPNQNDNQHDNNAENQKLTWYEKFSHPLEYRGLRFTIYTTIAVLIGGLVEIPPFFLQGNVQKIASVKPYSALELAGRDVYQSEGCFYCHTQMIRPFKWETDRWDINREYGAEPYSKAGEYVYDHPFLWGSKRTGPDLSHEASLQPSAAWHKAHLINPREMVPTSIMPAYPWLFEKPIKADEVVARMNALKTIGVPYSDDELKKAPAEVEGKTQGDALVAYLLKLGRDTKGK